MGLFTQPNKLSGEVDGVKHLALPRDQPRVMVRVVIASANGSSPCGVWWPFGESTQLIYADELETLKSRTQTDEHRAAWKRAAAVCERDIKRAIEEEWRSTSDKSDKKKAETEERVRAKTKSAPSVEFARDFRSGMPPVVSFEILRSDIPPPATPEANQAALMQAVIGRSSGPDAALRAENDELRGLIGKLTKRLEAVEKSTK